MNYAERLAQLTTQMCLNKHPMFYEYTEDAQRTLSRVYIPLAEIAVAEMAKVAESAFITGGQDEVSLTDFLTSGGLIQIVEKEGTV